MIRESGEEQEFTLLRYFYIVPVLLLSGFDLYIAFRYGQAKVIADSLVVLFGHIGVLDGHGGDITLTVQDLDCHLTGGVSQVVVADRQGGHAAAGAI